MSDSDRSKRYAATAKGKAAIARKREREQEKRQAKQSSVPLANGATPAPTNEPIPVRKFTELTAQQETAAFDYLWEHRSPEEAIEYMVNRNREKMDRLEHDTFVILRNPRTTTEQKEELAKAMDGAIERLRCILLWLQSTCSKDSEQYRAETPKERMVRLSHKLYMDDGDEDFVRNMLLKSLESSDGQNPS